MSVITKHMSLALISAILYFTPSFAQSFDPNDFRKELSIKLDIIDEKRIEKGVKLMNEASVIEKQAIDMIESMAENDKLNGELPDYKKAVKKLNLASETYREGTKIIYTVFQENCVKFGEKMKKMNHYAAGLNKAKYYERKGAQAFEKAFRIRDLIKEMEKPELIQYKMAESLELEKLSIRDRGRAVQIYQDFPIEYHYNWDNDVTDEEVAAAFKDPAISHPPDDFFVQRNTEISVNQSKGMVEPIIFKVQIAAHTLKMDEKYLRENIYFGALEIEETFEDNWYKYSIGEFNNFREADKLLRKAQVRKAFIVAYQAGNKLTIKEALEIIKANQ